MIQPSRISRILSVAIYLAVCFQTTPLWAQVAEEETKARWVLSYALIGALIGLSLFSICRTANRQKR